MNIFFQRCALALLIAVFQHSFLNVIWPSLSAPGAVIALIVSFVFLEGFARGGLTALLAVFFYLLLGEADHVIAFFAVVVAYGTSFLSRRLVIERSLQTSFVLTLASAGFVTAYNILIALLTHTSLSIGHLFAGIFQVVLVFPGIFFLITIWEKYIRESAMSEFRGMRT